MHFSLSSISTSILISTFLFLFHPGTIAAHVDSDTMPDAVAEMEYRIYLEFSPQDTTVLNKLGMVLFRRNKLKEAEATFQKIFAIDPENYDALDGLGLISARRGQHEAACDLFRKALRINPDDHMLNYHLGLSLEETGNLTQAADAYRTALEKSALLPREQAEKKNNQLDVDTIRTSLKNVMTKITQQKNLQVK